MSGFSASIALLAPIFHGEGGFKAMSTNEIMFLFLLSTGLFFHFYSLFLFGSVICLDFQRRYALIKFLTRLIQPSKNAFGSPLFKKTYKSHLFPREWGESDPFLQNGELQTLLLSDA